MPEGEVNDLATGIPTMKPLPDGNTRPAKDQRPAPRLPHERDESADSQTDTGNDVEGMGRRAYEDLRDGQVDTGTGPVLERVGRRLGPKATSPAADHIGRSPKLR